MRDQETGLLLVELELNLRTPMHLHRSRLLTLMAIKATTAAATDLPMVIFNVMDNMKYGRMLGSRRDVLMPEEVSAAVSPEREGGHREE